MACAIRMLVAALLAYFLIGSASAQENIPQTLKYKSATKAIFSVSDVSKKSVIKINSEVYMSPHPYEQYAYNIVYSNVSIIVEREGKQSTELTKCLSGAVPTYSLLQPFLAVYTANRGLVYIKVSKDEPEMAVNLKLYAAAFLQLDEPQLTQGNPSIMRKYEVSYAGMCETYHTLKGQDDNGFVHVEKLIDLTTCSEVTNDRRGDGLVCRAKVCRPSAERNLTWTSKADAQVKEVNGDAVIYRYAFSAQANYKPFVNSQIETVADIKSKAELQSIGDYPGVPVFRDTQDVEILSIPRYKPVNQNICAVPASKDNEHLQHVYSTLTCIQPFSTLFEDIIERTLTCNY